MENALQRKLLDWYRRNARALPWRADVSPYPVWLSEIMLQQTRVETVIGYYARFLEALPDVQSLADAPEETCLKLWEGLGYYSRVRNMQKAARIVTSEFGGRLPETKKELLRLPGIGDYTASAIASIAFAEPAVALDGNLLRVFARMTAYEQDARSNEAKELARAFFSPLMNGNAPGDGAERMSETQNGQAFNLPGSVNQALMDLGATVCLANAAPVCDACPWREECEARRQEKTEQFPIKTEKKPRPVADRTVLVILRGENIALRRRPRKGLLAGLNELPNTAGILDEAGAVRFAKELGFSPLRVKRLPPAKHVFTHREWHMAGYEIRADELSPFPADCACDEGLRLPVFLADKKEIRERFAVPSAFSAFLSLYL